MHTYMSEQERSQTLCKLTREIASALGKPWRYAEDRQGDYPQPYIAHVHDDARLTVGIVWNQTERLTIAGWFRFGENGQSMIRYGQTVPEITVAMARGAEAIAHEIERRLLPTYLPMLTEAVQRRDHEKQFLTKCRANLERLARLCGEDLSKDTDRERDRFVSYGGEHDRHHLEVYCSDVRADIKIDNLTMEEAEAVIRLVRHAGA